ncbi:MAG: hypothetical protein ACK2UO_05980, partial [Caldilineaceae bacterium]
PELGDQAVHADTDQDHTVESTDEVGAVDFPVTCSDEAQVEFNHGVSYLHSFWFGPAIDSFQQTANLDPSCAMAHWGIAMATLGIPWSPTPEEAVAAGLAAIEQADAVGAQTPHEQAYIDAATLLYKDADTLDFPGRTGAYATAMEELVQAYPDDTEAKVFYALALLMTAPRTDTTYANQRKASEILEPIFVELPEHPGVAHYLVHSYDYPALAENGLDAAQRFAKIAPAAPHALHMPAHIFTRLGYWEESIATNRASAEAAKPVGQDPGVTSEGALHAMDYMMYGYLQRGQDEAAAELLRDVRGVVSVESAGFGAAYALAAMPARYVLERGQWADAAELSLSPEDFPWERFPQAEAQLVFARALGAARTGDVEAALQDIDRLKELQEAMLATNQGYWADQAEVQLEAISAWIELSEGSPQEALATMRHAVELEAVMDKHPVTPGPIVPAQELLGEMLLGLDQPEEALAVFEASQEVEPNRFRGLYGAARAAELSGQTDRARTLYEELVALGSDASGDRAALTDANAFLTQ